MATAERRYRDVEEGDTVVAYRPSAPLDFGAPPKRRVLCSKIYTVGKVVSMDGKSYAQLDPYDGHPAGAAHSLFDVPLERVMRVHVPGEKGAELNEFHAYVQVTDATEQNANDPSQTREVVYDPPRRKLIASGGYEFCTQVVVDYIKGDDVWGEAHPDAHFDIVPIGEQSAKWDAEWKEVRW